MEIMTPLSALSVTHLEHHFGFTSILENISFELQRGEVYSIIGPSGGGKTTLLRLCAGLMDVEEGEVKNSFRSSAFAFQDARLLPWKNLIENISLGLIAQGTKKKEAVKKAKAMALDFGLEPKDFEKFPKDLSGGMKQRASFARALVVNPELLFLDEPFSALDIGLKRHLQIKLMDLVEDENLSILFITHDLNEAVRLSNKIFLLKSEPGSIVKTYTISRPRQERDDRFIYEKVSELLTDEILRRTFEMGVGRGN